MYEEAMTRWNDERPIKSLVMAGDDGNRWWTVGSGGVTRIELYREGARGGSVVLCQTGGQGGAAIWFAIYQGDWLAYRANGALIEHVWYGEPPDEE